MFAGSSISNRRQVKNVMGSTAKAAQRLVQTLKFSFIVAGALFVFVTYKVPAKGQHPADPTMALVISLIALADVAIGFLAPQFLVRSNRSSSGASSLQTPTQQWFARCVLSLAFFQSCNLFAVVLHFVHANSSFVEVLFAVGMLSMIVWSPGTPPGGEGGAGAI